MHTLRIILCCLVFVAFAAGASAQGSDVVPKGADVELEEQVLHLYRKESTELWATLTGRSLNFTNAQTIELVQSKVIIFDDRAKTADGGERKVLAEITIEQATFDTAKQTLDCQKAFKLILPANSDDKEATKIEGASALLEFVLPASKELARQVFVRNAVQVDLTSTMLNAIAPRMTAAIDYHVSKGVDQKTLPSKMIAECAASTRFAFTSMDFGDASTMLGLTPTNSLSVQSLSTSTFDIVEGQAFTVKCDGGALVSEEGEQVAFLQCGALQLNGSRPKEEGLAISLDHLHAYNRVVVNRPALNLRCWELTYTAPQEFSSSVTLSGPTTIELKADTEDHSQNGFLGSEIRASGMITLLVKKTGDSSRKLKLDTDGGFRVAVLLAEQRSLRLRGDMLSIESEILTTPKTPPHDFLTQLIGGLSTLSVHGRGLAPLVTLEKGGQRLLAVRGERLRATRDYDLDLMRVDVSGSEVQFVAQSQKSSGEATHVIEFAAKELARVQFSPFSAFVSLKDTSIPFDGDIRVQANNGCLFNARSLHQHIGQLRLSGTKFDASMAFTSDNANDFECHDLKVFVRGSLQEPAEGFIDDNECLSEELSVELNQESAYFRFSGQGNATLVDPNVIQAINTPASMVSLPPSVRANWKADLATVEWRNGIALDFTRTDNSLGLRDVWSQGPVVFRAWLTGRRAGVRTPTWAERGGWEWLGFENAKLVARCECSNFALHRSSETTSTIKVPGQLTLDLPLSGVRVTTGGVLATIDSETLEVVLERGLYYEELNSDGPLRATLGSSFDYDGAANQYDGPLRFELEGPAILSYDSTTFRLRNTARASFQASKLGDTGAADTVSGSQLDLLMVQTPSSDPDKGSSTWMVKTAELQRDVQLLFDGRSFQFDSASYNPETRRIQFKSSGIGNNESDIATIEGNPIFEISPQNDGNSTAVLKVRGRNVTIRIRINQETPTEDAEKNQDSPK